LGSELKPHIVTIYHEGEVVLLAGGRVLEVVIDAIDLGQMRAPVDVLVIVEFLFPIDDGGIRVSESGGADEEFTEVRAATGSRNQEVKIGGWVFDRVLMVGM
jgi:hypothetical protein